MSPQEGAHTGAPLHLLRSCLNATQYYQLSQSLVSHGSVVLSAAQNLALCKEWRSFTPFRMTERTGFEITLHKKSPPARLDRWPQRRREAGRKPSSVPGCPGDDHSSRTPVTRGLQRPTRELRAGHPQTLPYLVLLQVGFSKPAMSPLPLVSSYLTFSPLPWTYHGGLVSEALSLGLPPLGITQHPALWSSDFPPAASRAAGDHLACFAALWR